MTTPDIVLAGLVEAQESADSTLSWRLRPATVAVAGAGTVMIRFDGEGFEAEPSVDVPATSLIGYLAVGARVMVNVVPPSGCYVAADLTGATSEYTFTDTLDSTTSTTYVSTGVDADLVGIAFIVPASGKVKIIWGAECAISGGVFVLVSPQIAEGDNIDEGDIVVPAADSDTARADTSAVVRSTNFLIFNAADFNVTPGAQLNVTLYHRVNAGTGTISRRRVAAVPVR